jgi:hypothetical protein
MGEVRCGEVSLRCEVSCAGRTRDERVPSLVVRVQRLRYVSIGASSGSGAGETGDDEGSGLAGSRCVALSNLSPLVNEVESLKDDKRIDSG